MKLELERLGGYYEPKEISIEEVNVWLAEHKKKQENLKEIQNEFDKLFAKAKALIQECYAIGDNFLKEDPEPKGISVANGEADPADYSSHYKNYLKETFSKLEKCDIESIDNVKDAIEQWKRCIKNYLVEGAKIDIGNGIIDSNVLLLSRKGALKFGDTLEKLLPLSDLKNLSNELEKQQENLVELDKKLIAPQKHQDALLDEFKEARKRIQSKFPEVDSAYYYRLNNLINNESKYLDKNSKLSTDVIKKEWSAISKLISEEKYPEAKQTIPDVRAYYGYFLKIAELHNQNLDTISSLKYYEERRNTTSNNSSRAEPEKSENESQQSISNNVSTVVRGSDEESKAALLFLARYGSDQTRNYFAVALAVLAIGLAVAACCFVSPVAIGFFAVGSVVAGAAALCLPFEKPAPIL
jgi:hypothetical protein